MKSIPERIKAVIKAQGKSIETIERKLDNCHFGKLETP